MTDELDRAWDRLRFHLELQEGFWLAVVVGEPGDRDRLRERVRQWAAAVPTRLEVHEPGALADRIDALSEAPDALHWVELGAGGASRSAAGALLVALNQRRDALRRSQRSGLVLSGPAWLKADLRNLAPDLFSVRACVLETGSADDAPVPQPGAWEAPAPPDWGDARAIPPVVLETDDRVVVEAVRTQLGRASALAEHPEESARRSRASALHQAAEGLLAQGWVGEAAPIVEQLYAAVLELGGEAGDAWVRTALAEALELQGRIARDQGDLEGARQAFDRALGVTRRLRDERDLDEATAPLWSDEARLWWSLGEVHFAAGRLSEAERALQHSRRIREALAARAPEDPERRADLATAWSLLADVAAAQGRTEAADEAWSAALSLRQALVEAAPGSARYRRYLSVARGRQARMLARQGDRPGALRALAEACALAESLVEADPGNAGWEMEAAIALGRYGDALLDAGRLEAATRVHRRSLEVRSRLAADDPENARWQAALARQLARMAALHRARHEPDEARVWAHRACNRLEALTWEDPGNLEWSLALAEAREQAAEAALADGDPETARQDFTAAAATFDGLLERGDRVRWRVHLARLRTREGEAAWDAGDRRRARDAWALALAACESLSEEPDRRCLGPLVGLARCGEAGADEAATSLIDALEADGSIAADEADRWRGRLPSD